MANSNFLIGTQANKWAYVHHIGINRVGGRLPNP
jgi:hypothetical protein